MGRPTTQRKAISSFQALEKAKNSCANQEYCPFDIRRKLAEWGIDGEQAEWVIKELKSGDYLNEERYARAFVRGKFNIKSWGMQKISAALRKKNISEDCIKQAISEIEGDAYTNRLNIVAEKWLAQHKDEAADTKKMKLYRFLSLKGYETNEIWNFINANKDFY